MSAPHDLGLGIVARLVALEARCGDAFVRLGVETSAPAPVAAPVNTGPMKWDGCNWVAGDPEEKTS
jgi:hypothetical protein